MALKVKVSKEGHSATSLAMEDKDLVFSSDWLAFKIKNTIDFSVTVSGGTGTTTEAHGLSYIPVAYGYIKDSQGRWQTDAYFDQKWDWDNEDCDITKFKIEVNDTNVYVTVEGNDGTYTGKIVIIDEFI